MNMRRDIMLRKRNEQYAKYEQRKLYYCFSKLSAVYGDASSYETMSDGAILGIYNTHMVMDGDQSQLNEE